MPPPPSHRAYSGARGPTPSEQSAPAQPLSHRQPGTPVAASSSHAPWPLHPASQAIVPQSAPAQPASHAQLAPETAPPAASKVYVHTPRLLPPHSSSAASSSSSSGSWLGHSGCSHALPLHIASHEHAA